MSDPLDRLARLRLKKSEALALFAFIRERSDHALLGALGLASPPARNSRPGDPFTDEIKAILAAILAPLAEKADYLHAELERSLARPLALKGRGFAQRVRALRALCGAKAVRDAAEAIVARARAAASGDRPP
jgi:hypothetical protein